MYLHDPVALVQHPTLAETEEEVFEEPRDYHEFFWDEAVQRGRSISGISERLYTQVCKFDEDGNHTVMARNCPHFDLEDEEGKRIQRGWTAQC